MHDPRTRTEALRRIYIGAMVGWVLLVFSVPAFGWDWRLGVVALWSGLLLTVTGYRFAKEAHRHG